MPTFKFTIEIEADNITEAYEIASESLGSCEVITIKEETIRIAICKIYMIGSPCLIIGICTQQNGKDYWHKYQHFTLEEYLKSKDKGMQEVAQKLTKLHGQTIQFDSISEPVEIHNDNHSFSFANATQTEITQDQFDALTEEMKQDNWEEFDIETWGK